MQHHHKHDTKLIHFFGRQIHDPGEDVQEKANHCGMHQAQKKHTSAQQNQRQGPYLAPLWQSQSKSALHARKGIAPSFALIDKNPEQGQRENHATDQPGNSARSVKKQQQHNGTRQGGKQFFAQLAPAGPGFVTIPNHQSVDARGQNHHA